MTCKHEWLPMIGTLEGKTIGSGYYCLKCDRTAAVCPGGAHPEGFPWEGRKCDWCQPQLSTKQ